MDLLGTRFSPREPWLDAALRRPIVRFLAIGVVSTAAYALLVLVLLGPLGSSGANLVALALTAIANTAANRRLTFGVRGREGLARQYAASLLVFLLALVITDGALALLDRYDQRPSHPVDLTVLVAATLLATICRFVALRTFVFTGTRRGLEGPAASRAPGTGERHADELAAVP